MPNTPAGKSSSGITGFFLPAHAGFAGQGQRCHPAQYSCAASWSSPDASCKEIPPQLVQASCRKETAEAMAFHPGKCLCRQSLQEFSRCTKPGRRKSPCRRGSTRKNWAKVSSVRSRILRCNSIEGSGPGPRRKATLKIQRQARAAFTTTRL